MKSAHIKQPFESSVSADVNLALTIARNFHHAQTRKADDSPYINDLLNDGEITIGGMQFIGSTLWTDYDLSNSKSTSALFALEKMHDYRVIRFNQGGRYRKLTVGDTVRLHSEGLTYLKQQLAISKNNNQKTVVISHHGPSAQSVTPEYKDDKLAPAYCSNLDAILHEFEPQLWIHGHTHHNVDYHIGKTRVLSNQRGYVPEERVKTFDESFIIEI